MTHSSASTSSKSRSHPAKYSDSLIGILYAELKGSSPILDPFAGTGKIANIIDLGFEGEIYCSELEPEWAGLNDPRVAHWNIGDSSSLPYSDGFFEAICTSPVYGNRMSDHYNIQDNSKRYTYQAFLGRDLHKRNAGRMNWGKKYRDLHEGVYLECDRVLAKHGKFILNVSDHVRSGKVVRVSDWHASFFMDKLGYSLERHHTVETPRMKHGDNSKLRIDHENIFVFLKGEK